MGVERARHREAALLALALALGSAFLLHAIFPNSAPNHLPGNLPHNLPDDTLPDNILGDDGGAAREGSGHRGGPRVGPRAARAEAGKRSRAATALLWALGLVAAANGAIATALHVREWRLSSAEGWGRFPPGGGGSGYGLRGSSSRGVGGWF